MTELAWAAGFFDGEGCTSLSRNRQYKLLAMNIGQVDRQPLERFVAAVGINKRILGPYKKGKNKPYYEISVNKFEEVQYVMCQLWKWLCKPKRDQYKTVIADYLDYYRRLHQ